MSGQELIELRKSFVKVSASKLLPFRLPGCAWVDSETHTTGTLKPDWHRRGLFPQTVSLIYNFISRRKVFKTQRYLLEESGAFGKTKPRFASVLPEGSQKHPVSQKTIIRKPTDAPGKILLSLGAQGFLLCFLSISLVHLKVCANQQRFVTFLHSRAPNPPGSLLVFWNWTQLCSGFQTATTGRRKCGGFCSWIVLSATTKIRIFID